MTKPIIPTPITVVFWEHKPKHTRNPFVKFAYWCYRKATPMHAHVCLYSPRSQHYYTYDTLGYGTYTTTYGKDSKINKKHTAYILDTEAMLQWEKECHIHPHKENLWIKTKLVASYLLPFLRIKNCSSEVAKVIGITEYINTPDKLDRYLSNTRNRDHYYVTITNNRG